MTILYHKNLTKSTNFSQSKKKSVDKANYVCYSKYTKLDGGSNKTREVKRLPENILSILESIKEAKGEEYVEGLVDMANLLAPRKTEEHRPG